MMVSAALPRRGCVLSVRLEPGVDKTVTASWYDIWAAAIAVQQICVARGRSGATVDVGMLYFLFFFPHCACEPTGSLDSARFHGGNLDLLFGFVRIWDHIMGGLHGCWRG